MIPDEAVEAAARGIALLNLSSKPWGAIGEEVKNTFRDDARAALAAATPFMLAEAWDRCVGSDTPWINPYRSQA